MLVCIFYDTLFLFFYIYGGNVNEHFKLPPIMRKICMLISLFLTCLNIPNIRLFNNPDPKSSKLENKKSTIKNQKLLHDNFYSKKENQFLFDSVSVLAYSKRSIRHSFSKKTYKTA